jgi:hypothetical protein
MVSKRERGQLILVGALTIALSIVAITVFLNTTLFAESVAPSTASDQLDDARQFDQQARGGATELLHRINLGERNRTLDELEENATKGVHNYSQILAASYAQSGAASVDVSLDPNASEYGNRTVQLADGNFTDTTADGDWEPLPVANRTIGWFVVDMNVEESTTAATNLTVSNGTGAEIELSVRKNLSGTGTNVTVVSDPDFGSADQVTCDTSFGRVLIDLYRGRVVGTTCATDSSFTGIEALSPPHALEVTNGDSFTGEYEYVLNQSVPSSPPISRCDTGEPTTEPCATPALWQANLSTAYLGTAATYRNSYNVSIYAETNP